MKIIINTAHQRFGGAIQVALSFIYECIKFPENEYFVWLGPGLQNLIIKSDFPLNFHFFHFDFGQIGFGGIRKIQKTLRPYELKIKPDVIIATSGPTYYHSIAPQIIGYNLPWYIYPESPFMVDLPLKKKIKYWIRKKIHFYYFKRDAIAYLVQTNDVMARVKKVLNTNNVHTVTNNHNHYYISPITDFNLLLPPKAENEIRILTITAYYPHKNLEIISKIANLFIEKGFENIKFVITVKDEDYKKYIGESRLIINMGPIKPQDCPQLYSECDIMFLPTLAECFSASYPEAMVMRKPIITSDLGFARSICGDAAIYFEPKNPRDAYERILKLISNTELKENLVKNGIKQLKVFDTPSERAKKYIDICNYYKAN